MKISIFNFMNYKFFLNNILELRIKTNSSYSLRAFARDLQLSPSLVSQVLSNKNNLSCKHAFSVAHHLKLNQEETYYLVDLILMENSSDKESKKQAGIRINKKKEYQENLKNASTLEECAIATGWQKNNASDEIPGFWFCD
jgi:uncharacterized protein (TIGR02147 family)